MARPKLQVEKQCAHCGRDFLVKRSWADTRRYCSKICMNAFEDIHGRPTKRVVPIQLTCTRCGETFAMKPAYLREYRKRYGKNPPYCSRTCAGLAKRLPIEQWQVACIQCGKPMPIQRRPGGTVNRQKRLCSTACRSAFRRADWQAKHADAEPTRHVKRGYVRLIIPGTNGGAARDVLEHRYVMERHLGRSLAPEETVHHINGDRQHNTIDNLELFSSRHGPGQRVIDKVAFAIEILRLYPDFAEQAGVRLVDVSGE